MIYSSRLEYESCAPLKLPGRQRTIADQEVFVDEVSVAAILGHVVESVIAFKEELDVFALPDRNHLGQAKVKVEHRLRIQEALFNGGLWCCITRNTRGNVRTGVGAKRVDQLRLPPSISVANGLRQPRRKLATCCVLSAQQVDPGIDWLRTATNGCKDST